MKTHARKRAALDPLPAPRPNPGALRGFFYMPPNPKAMVPLVVVLHGCGQDAAGYDQGSGWSRLR